MTKVALDPHAATPHTPQSENHTKPRFIADGEGYVPARDAARTILLAGDLSPSGAYAALKRAAQRGQVRTTLASPRTRCYHALDVARLAASLRGE